MIPTHAKNRMVPTIRARILAFVELRGLRRSAKHKHFQALKISHQALKISHQALTGIWKFRLSNPFSDHLSAWFSRFKCLCIYQRKSDKKSHNIWTVNCSLWTLALHPRFTKAHFFFGQKNIKSWNAPPWEAVSKTNFPFKSWGCCCWSFLTRKTFQSQTGLSGFGVRAFACECAFFVGDYGNR